MTLRFTRKHVTIVGLSLIVLVGISYLIHYILVKPLETEIYTIESNIAMQQKFIDVLNEKQGKKTAPVVSSTELQKKIPVVPLVEQVILDLQQAESVSNSKISNMSFSESAFSLPVEELTTPTADQQEGVTTEGTQSEKVDVTSEPTSEQPAFDQTLLEGMKQVTVSLTVESPGYKGLEEFLTLIEHQTRITKVDSLTFTGKQEITSVDENIDEPLVYAITLSTFYMSAYSELADDAPKINVPKPANKKNPLFTNTLDDEEE